MLACYTSTELQARKQGKYANNGHVLQAVSISRSDCMMHVSLTTLRRWGCCSRYLWGDIAEQQQQHDNDPSPVLAMCAVHD